ncbi:MAG: hypothetical protein WCE81_11955 [Halobacteriota archaeon]
MVLGINLEAIRHFCKNNCRSSSYTCPRQNSTVGFRWLLRKSQVGCRKKRIESHLALFSGSVGLTPYAKGRSSNKKGY